MNRIARVACAAAATVALTSLTPIAPASPAPDVDVRQSAAPTYQVVASINRTEVVAGEDTVRITGKVRPRAAGQKVVLQQRRDETTRWVKTGSARIRSTGRFVLKDDPSNAGVRYYRVVKPASDGVRAGTSRQLRLEVWEWRALWQYLSAYSGVSLVPVSIGGTVHGNSLVLTTAGTTGLAEFTLGRKVRALRATYALTDSSATGASGSVIVSVDGVPAATHQLATGTVVANYVVDTTDAFRVRFDLTGSASPAGLAVVGNLAGLFLP